MPSISLRDLADVPELAAFTDFSDYMQSEYRKYCEEYRNFQRMGLLLPGDPPSFQVWLTRYEGDYAWARA